MGMPGYSPVNPYAPQQALPRPPASMTMGRQEYAKPLDPERQRALLLAGGFQDIPADRRQPLVDPAAVFRNPPEMGPPRAAMQGGRFRGRGATGSWTPDPGKGPNGEDMSEPITPEEWALWQKEQDEWDAAQARGKTGNTPKTGRGGRGGGGKGETPDLPEPVRQEMAVEDQASKNLKALIGQVKGKKQLDLTPILALTDAWTGSNFAQSYDRPMNQEERDKLAMGLEMQLQTHEDNIEMKRQALAQRHEEKLENEKIRREALANQLKVAQISAGSRENVAGIRAAAVGDRVKTKKYQDAFRRIAGMKFGDPKDPRGHSAVGKAMAHRIESIAVPYAEHLEATGQAEPGQGLELAVRDLEDYPNGKDAAPAATGATGGW